MTTEERKKFNKSVEAVEKLQTTVDKLANPMIYNYIDDNMPKWAKEPVQYFVDHGVLQGTGDGLGLSEIKLWVLTILYRIIKKINK